MPFFSIFQWMQTIELPLPDDFHVHLRQGPALASYAKTVSKEFGRILVMPNTVPPIASAKAILDYRAEIKSAVPELETLMTFKLNSKYTAMDLEQMKLAGAVAGKYYPAGVTTNSEDGVSDFESVLPVISEMEKLGLVLCVHGEEPSAFCLDREKEFIKRVEFLSAKFPKLKIVFEHLSTAAAVEAVLRLPQNVVATLTVHHLLQTLDDVVGGSLSPHHFCKPLPKRPEDREALRQAAFSGNPKFFFGSDSAPHEKEKKEGPCGAAGVYSAPVAVPLLIEIFERAYKLNKLPDFIGGFGADFYGIPRHKEIRKYGKEDWIVPQIVNGAVPLFAGKTLHWHKI
ncbi:MAG: dihydroorotase [Fibrobacteraceae bacterium]|nr:dihydroorotase [Fibrobacteraceae bacterium]